MRRNKSIGSKLFDGFNHTLLALYALINVLPFIYIISCSFATPQELISKKFMLFPSTFTLDTYRYIFSTDTLAHSMRVSILITVIGTITNLVFTALMAYPLAHANLMGRKVIMVAVVFTMQFNGGMIPTFLVVKSMGLMNSYAALILPGAISAFNLIIMKNFFQQIPMELEESATIDGCNHLKVLFRIILPLSKPALATLALFYAVGHWNTFTSAILYLNNSRKWPIQVLLRQIIILSQGGIGNSDAIGESFQVPQQGVKMATIVVSTLPILIVYPYLQKYFTKGVMLGSIKG